MPILEIATNLAKTQIPSEFLPKASAEIAKLVGKPESYVQVIVNGDQLISCAGSNQPSAFVRFTSIGRVDKHAVSELTKLISEGLNIAQDRFYLSINDIDPHTLAYKGSTFA